MTTKTDSKLDWTELEYDRSSPVAELIFGNTWVSDIGPDEFYWVYPVQDPIEKKQMWAIDYCAIEIGRVNSLTEGKQVAQDHFSSLLTAVTTA